MKQILIITSDSGKTVAWKEREAYVLDFAKKVTENVPESVVEVAIYSDMLFSVKGNKPLIFNSKSGRNLDEYDFVHFKNWQYELEDASVIAGYLDKRGIAFANSEVNNGLNFNKLSQMFTLAFSGVSVPNTVYGKPTDKGFAELLKSTVDFPMIVKANDGSRGDSNYLAVDSKELEAIISNEPDIAFVFQEFIPNKGDYRLLFIGNSAEPMVFLRQGDGTSHLNNTSKGGNGKMLRFQQLSPDIRRDALTAVKALKREISGVDVIINNKTGEHYILEVNSTPALATGFATNEKIQAFSKFIENLTEEMEEE